MINLRDLISYLPTWYKDNDTYLDSENRGILERFLNICGNYLKDEVTTEIDDITNILSLDSTPNEFLNYLWEFLGSVPYGQACSYTELVNGTWKEVINNTYPKADTRKLLAYIISLYAIRGTFEFYPALLKLYGYGEMVIDEEGNPMDITQEIIEDPIVPVYDDGLLFDDGITFDIAEGRTPYVSLNLSISIYHEATDDFIDRLLLLLNRYRPVHIKEFKKENLTFRVGFPYVLPLTFQ